MAGNGGHGRDRARDTEDADSRGPAGRNGAAGTGGDLDALVRRIEGQFAVLAGNPALVRETVAALRERLDAGADGPAAATVARRLAALARTGHGEIARALVPFLAVSLRTDADPTDLATALLAARDRAVRREAVAAVLERWSAPDLALRPDLAGRLAAALLAVLEEPESAGGTTGLLDRAAALLGRLPAAGAAAGPEVALETLVMDTASEPLRRLAARILDRDGEPVPADRLARLLGPAAAGALGDLCQFTRASHRDLVDLTPDGPLTPARLAEFAAARDCLGATALGAVIGELGWRAVSAGLWVEQRIGLSLDGGFPLAVLPDEATLLEACGPARRAWDRILVVAHGGTATLPGGTDAEAAAVRRFRRYNLLHAELLGEILEVAPVTPAKVERILARLDEAVDHFIALFAGHTEDTTRVAAVYAALRAPIVAGLAGRGADEPLDGELTRLVQMFEDPRQLNEVRTLHGLKRYLHQQGLRLAFRRFRTSGTANRTIDLALVAGGRVVRTVRKIRYLDFEPPAQPGAIPFFPALVVEAYGRRLLHGRTDAPDLEILIYGNEVQTFVAFRNHPAFLRIDFSPPLRGGMIDLEYFGVSQYEVDSHPDLTLPWIRRIFGRLDFDAQVDGLKLHIRYDKERAFDFSDLVRRARLLCSLMPHLMDLDWILGGVRYPEPAKAAIVDRWADWVARWGLLPLEDLLTSDRRAILQEIREDPLGPSEIPWDGRGEVRDRFPGTPPASFWPRLRAVLAGRGLAGCVRWSTVSATEPGQLPLQAAVLEPLRAARTPGAPRPDAEPDAPLRCARLLAEGGEPLGRAARLAVVVASVERHLRFTTVGSVQEYPVEQATLRLPGEICELAVLRDAAGIVRLAIARERPFFLTPGPPPRCVREGCAGRDIDDRELLARLRRDNYLAASQDLSPAALAAEQASLASLFAAPNPLAMPAPRAGDRTVAGIAAAPGKAAGIAAFYRPDLRPDDLEGAVLFAPAVRPEDTPLLRRAAAVVSTGGGILSHAGLIALELGKPALVVEGSWRLDEASRPELDCRTVDYVEHEQQVGPYRVAVRRDLREREERLRAGDLVVVDAELGCLGVLGQDRDALALQDELSRLDAVTAQMQRTPEGPAKLELRGRLLRTTHQLGKLLARLDQPALARHAARELLCPHRAAGAAASAPDPAAAERPALLRRLFANPRCGAIARDAAVREEAVLARRLDALRDETVRALAGAETLHEVLHLRLVVQRLERTVDGARRALATAGEVAAAPVDDAPERLDECARERLVTLRGRCADDLSGCAGDPDRRWRARPLLAALDTLDRLLGPPADQAARHELRRRARAALSDLELRARARLAGRALVAPADGGLELAPLIGGKGAGLAEIARVLGPAFVPPWFAVTDTAFRHALSAGIGAVDPALGLVSGMPLLVAIGRVLDRTDLAIAAQAAAIRELWRSTRLPDDLAGEIDAAYRALGTAAGTPAEPYVAVRSSTFEEDSPRSSWAGQFDTFLFIRGAGAVREHLKLAWASLWSERVLRYRQALAAAGAVVAAGHETDLAIEAYPGGGILIQRIVDSRVAGVMQTLAAASGQPREMVLNVGLGLGEGIVSGTVEVDQVVVSRASAVTADPLRFRYTVGDKRSRVVFDRQTGQGTRLEDTLYHQRLRPALEYTDLCDVVRAAVRLEADFGHPLDLEFAFEEDTLWILQARPIVAFQDAVRETAARSPWVTHPEPAVRDLADR